VYSEDRVWGLLETASWYTPTPDFYSPTFQSSSHWPFSPSQLHPPKRPADGASELLDSTRTDLSQPARSRPLLFRSLKHVKGLAN
jgi:hypothetical protein